VSSYLDSWSPNDTAKENSKIMITIDRYMSVLEQKRAQPRVVFLLSSFARIIALITLRVKKQMLIRLV